MAERDADSPSPRLDEALRLIAAEARERLAARGADATGRGTLELALRLPLPATPQDLARARQELGRELDAEVDGWVQRRALAAPGRTFCLRCASALCAHAVGGDLRQVFAGYGSTGLPRFVDLGQLLLERRDPRVGILYGERPGFVALEMSGEELHRDLLPGYRDERFEVRLHGQVVAGWYGVANGNGGARVAAGFQVLAAGSGRRRRLALHPVGAAADPAVLEALHARGDRLPWRDAVAWAETTLQQIEAAGRRRAHAPDHLQRRIDGVLRHLAERLDRPHRTRQRHTAHADDRHRSRQRPTRAAIADLFDAPLERIFFDGRHGTFLVLGRRGRTHVWSPEGKLVTSLRYPANTVEKRQKLGEWRPVAGTEAADLLERVRAEENGEPAG